MYPMTRAGKGNSVSRIGHYKEMSGGSFDNDIKNNGIFWGDIFGQPSAVNY